LIVTLKDQLQEDLKTAMKAHDVPARETLRYTLAAIKNAEIEKGRPLTDAENLTLLQKEVKSRKDSIEQFQGAGREDLVERESVQLDVLMKYLPAEMSDEELQALVSEVVRETGATGPSDMRKVMPVLMQRAAGKADGKRLSAAVQQALAGDGQ
jgi:uncharacterized protein